MIFSWLHLSDWHQRGPDFDRNVVRDALLDDVAGRTAIAPGLASVQLVIFSGDLAHAGQEREYSAARDHLLEPIRKRLALEQRNFFFVPGNHDIDRDAVTTFCPPALQKPLDETKVKEWLTDDRKRAKLLEPFEAFRLSQQDIRARQTHRLRAFGRSGLPAKPLLSSA